MIAQERLPALGRALSDQFLGLSPAVVASSHEQPVPVFGDLCVLSLELHGLWINRFDGQRFRATRPKFPPAIDYFGWGWKQTAFQDRAGDWWIATGRGLLRFPKVASVEQLARTLPKAMYDARNGLITDDVFRVFEDSAGDIWLSTAADRGPRNGLNQWVRATGSFRDHSSLSSGLALAFREDRLGALWIGFNTGRGSLPQRPI